MSHLKYGNSLEIIQTLNDMHQNFCLFISLSCQPWRDAQYFSLEKPIHF